MKLGKDVTDADIIAEVRRRLSDDGTRIADTPQPFNHAWWPTEPEIDDLMLSDRGIAPGKPSSNRDVAAGLEMIQSEFSAEVKAIHDSLVDGGYVPRFAKWQRVKDVNGQALYKSMSIRATALSLWEQIAFPIRRHGDYVFRIWAPREVFGGSPIIHAVPVGRFARGAALRTAKDTQELVHLRQRLKLWRGIAGAAGVVILVLIWLWWSS